MIVLVGRTASDNDILSIKLSSPRDFWCHVASESGSHVVIRNPDNLERMPRETLRFAASLAARYSKARGAGKVAVHVASCSDVSKRRGSPTGQVTLGKYTTVNVRPYEGDDQ